MKGQILGFSNNEGVIVGEDGKRYHFGIEDWKESQYPLKNMKVDFEVEEDRAKNIYLLEMPPQMPQQNNSTIKIDSNIKILGGLGTIFILLSWIPYIGWLLALTGLILLSIALKKISNQAPSKGIFKNWIISIVISVTAAIILFFTILGAMSTYSSSEQNLLILLTYLIGVGTYIVVGILYKKIFMGVYELTNESLFKTSANLFFWGGILSIIVIGGFLFFIAWIIVAIAFFSLKTKEA